MNKSPIPRCSSQYATGGGVAVAEILGNWSQTGCKINPDHANIRRIKDIFFQMDELKTPTRNMQVIYNRKNDPESWYVPPSPPECRPLWTYAKNRPLITFTTSAVNRIPVFSFRNVKDELKNPAPGREYYEQGTYKWYKGTSSVHCHYQPTCCAPVRAEHSCIRPTR